LPVLGNVTHANFLEEVSYKHVLLRFAGAQIGNYTHCYQLNYRSIVTRTTVCKDCSRSRYT